MKTQGKIPIKKAVCIAGKTAKENKLHSKAYPKAVPLSSLKEQIGKIPQIYQQNYKTAMSGRSRTAAIKAKCLDCCCWQRVEIANCPIETCALWLYRPYRSPEKLKSPQKSGALEKKTAKGSS